MKLVKRYEWVTWTGDEERAAEEGDTPFRARILKNPNGAMVRHENRCLRAMVAGEMTEREYLAAIADRVIDWELEIEDPANPGQLMAVAAPGSPTVTDEQRDKQVDAFYELPTGALPWLCQEIRSAHIPKGLTILPGNAGSTASTTPAASQTAC